MAELLGAMDAAEWAEWQEFDRLEPVGDGRLERMLGVLAAMIANQWRGKGDSPVKVEDVLPDHGGGRSEAEARRRASPSWQKKQVEELKAGWAGFRVKGA